MSIVGLHHVSLLVSSEECLDFYKALGFEESYRRARQSDTVVLLEAYSFQLEVFIDPRHPQKAEGEQEPLGPRHFALRVDDISATLIFLREQGIDVEGVEVGNDWTGVKYCYLHDPDGNQVELHE